MTDAKEGGLTFGQERSPKLCLFLSRHGKLVDEEADYRLERHPIGWKVNTTEWNAAWEPAFGDARVDLEMRRGMRVHRVPEEVVAKHPLLAIPIDLVLI